MKAPVTPLLALAAALASACDEPLSSTPSSDASAVAADAGPSSAPREPSPRYDYRSVPVNRDVELPEGFRGEVHPLLHGQEPLPVTARWEPELAEEKRTGIELGVIDNASAQAYSVPDEMVALLTESRPARAEATHDARALSAFLPEDVEGPGQMWRIDPADAVPFLAQFHERVTTSFDSYHQPYGRRPGPAGAFGIVRAVSPGHVDVLFRVHAELVLREGAVVYTPACFLGRMLVDREAGRVEYLEMRVPTDRGVNVNLTLSFPLPSSPDKQVTNIVFERVDPMELVAGDPARLDAVSWDSEIELTAAHDRLKGAFYKFMDVGWVPVEDAVAMAREAKKPIMVVVLTSPLDDQSC